MVFLKQRKKTHYITQLLPKELKGGLDERMVLIDGGSALYLMGTLGMCPVRSKKRKALKT